MRRAWWLPVLVTVAVLAVPPGADASHLDSTAWALTGTSRVKVTGERAIRGGFPDSTLTVDAASQFVLTNDDLTVSGTYEDRARRRFKATLDQGSLDTMRTQMVEAVKFIANATDVRVRKFTNRTSGSVSKDGQTLRVRMRTTLLGSARIGNRWRAGGLILTANLSGPPAP